MENAWLTFWVVMLVISMSLFFGVAIVVSIKGGADLVHMLRSLQEKKEDDSNED